MIAVEVDNRSGQEVDEQGAIALAREVLAAEGVDDGELSRNIDARILSEMLYAPVYHRLLIGHRPLDDQFADDLIATALELPVPEPAARPRGATRRPAA